MDGGCVAADFLENAARHQGHHPAAAFLARPGLADEAAGLFSLAAGRAVGRVLDRLGVRYTPYYLLNAIEVDAGPLVRLWLEAQPEVVKRLVTALDRIRESGRSRPQPAPV